MHFSFSKCLFLITALIFVINMKSIGQLIKHNPGIGSIKGKAKDSVYNYMLISATVAIYRDKDSALLKYTLPDDLGEFTLASLPTEQPLRLIITHVGYKSFLKKITLNESNKDVNLGTIFMNQKATKDEGALEDEVVVTAIAPVRMNGDTLEFNADAFRLDSNATAEDLIRRLPGFTIWGDGDITFNGKKIQSVLVEGKPFMGTNDVTVATQNLPKNIIDKIQVYQQKNEKNPLDSTMFVNIKLKADKKMGYFGKLGFGYGTDSRYAVDGMLSGFNKKLQLSTVGAFNNINKLASNTDVLMKSSSFKGEGANIDYQSNFGMRGLNKPIVAGMKLQYDFISNVTFQNSSRINADYFINDNQTLINNNTLVNTFLQADTILSRRTISSNSNQSMDQNLNTLYKRVSEKMNLIINSNINSSFDKNLNIGNSQQEKIGVGIISNNVSNNENENYKKNINVGIEYSKQQNELNEKKRIPHQFTVGYQFSGNEINGNGRTQTKFFSALNTSNNKVFDRFYGQRDAQGSGHTITAIYPRLKKLIFNDKKILGIEIGLSGTFIFNNKSNTDKVFDIDSTSKNYQLNNYLTNTRKAEIHDFQPAINISKVFYKGLTNRFNKSVLINLNLKNQYYGMKNSATQTVQNFSYNYSKFIPDAAFEYNNNQYGSYEVKYSLNFSTSVIYPDINNIAPLVDSSNVWYIPKGNINIKPMYKEDLTVAYNFINRKPKNPFNFNLTASVGKIDKSITDSTLYDNTGIRTVYAVNLDGNRYISGGATIKKSIDLKNNSTFEMDTRYNINESRNPQYINGFFNINSSIYQNIRLSLGFRYKDNINLKVEQGFTLYNSEQKGFNNNQFINSNQYTRLIGTLLLPKYLIWSTNITYNKSSNNNIGATYFTIWNAGLTYRFLKGNRGEVKFATLDILRQNKGIINTANNNSQIFTSSNVLQQYYMLTLSYYPRKFGKNNKKN